MDEERREGGGVADGGVEPGGSSSGWRIMDSRDGAPPIDLVDGEKLVQKLKELGLGIRIRVAESVEIDEDWFAKL